MSKEYTKGGANCDLHDGQIFDNGGLVIANCYSSFRGIKTIKANANLIAEAFNVANETGMTPKELQERIKELEYVLDKLLNSHFRLSGGINNTPVETLAQDCLHKLKH